MASGRPDVDDGTFHVLALTQGLWGRRIAANVQAASPDWEVTTWEAPRTLPNVIDDPEDYLPSSFEPADLILSLGDTPGLAQLVPDIVERTAAQAVIAPIDRNCSLPPGLAHQLEGWLADLGVPVVFPKPFCTLTETTYNRPPIQRTYDDPTIARFAARFGRPTFRVTVDADEITNVDVGRQSACGSSLHIARGLVGTSVSEGVDEAAMLHHHFPCLAGMDIDTDYLDTLMHVSGNLVKDSMQAAIRAEAPERYIRPHGHVL
ncbi:MAG: DUF166 family protein [Anaerolineales bacterium]